MKKTTLLVLLLVFPDVSLGFILVKPVSCEVSSSSLSIDGDLEIPPYGTFDGSNKVVTVNGSVRVGFKGTLFLKNSTLNLIKSGSNIFFADSSLIAFDSKITSIYAAYIYFEGISSASVANTTIGLVGGGILVRDSTEASFTSTVLRGSLRTFNSSHVTAINSAFSPSTRELSSSITFMETYGSSTVSVSGTKIREISTYNNSSVVISSSFIRPATVELTGVPLAVRTFGSSQLIVLDSQKTWRVEAHDSSSVLILNTELERLTTYESSLVSLNKATITDGVLVYHSSKVFVFDSSLVKEAQLTAYLSTYGSSIVSISDTSLKGILSLHDSSSLSVENSLIEWLNTRGSSSASLSKSTLFTVNVKDNSHMSFRANSTVTSLRAYDSSSVSFLDSVVTMLSATNAAKISLENSKVKELLVNYKTINGSLSGARTGTVADWSSKVKTNIFIGTGGYAPSISLRNTKVDDWSLQFLTSPNVTLINSTLTSLIISATNAYLIGSSAASYDFSDGAKAYFYWYLDVQTPSNASVSVYDSNMTLVESKTASINGLATFILFERMMDAMNTYPSATYTIDVSSPQFSGQREVEMIGNKQVVLTPPPSFLEQYWYIIIIAVIAVAAVLLFFYRIKKGKLSFRKTVSFPT